MSDDTLPVLVNLWLKDCHRRNLSYYTIHKSYAYSLCDFLRWVAGDFEAARIVLSIEGRRKVVKVEAPEVKISASEIDLELLRSYVDHKRNSTCFTDNPHPWRMPKDRPLSPSTLHRYIQVLKIFFNWCAREEWLPESPAKKLRMPKLPNRGRRIEVFNEDEITVVLDAAKRLSYRNYAIVLTLLDTLLRRRELVTLTLDDVNLMTGLITVRHAKGDKVRWVRAGRHCQRVLRRYAREHRKPREGVNAFWLDRTGDRLSNGAIGCIFKRLSIKSGLHVYAHKLRHTGATLMAAQGVNAPQIADRLGHESLKMAQWYIHLAGMQHDQLDASPMDKILDAV